MPATDGKAVVAGYDVFTHPIEAKRRIGYLPETPPLYPDMTVREYLTFVARIKGVPAADRQARIESVMKRVWVADMAERHCAKLSKGYRQRVGLAQAIVHEPPVLVLDEPTSSLDPQQRTDVRQLILELKGRHTVILSTHILPEASEVADRVVIINRGRVVAVDTPAKLAERLRARESVRLEVGAPGGASPARMEEVRQALAALPGIRNISVEAGAADTIEARVESEIGVDLRAAAAALVTGRGWPLLALSGEPLSLEEIFLAITRSEDNGGA
jgi:ABC-2 type transport system ATP-binding protein